MKNAADVIAKLSETSGRLDKEQIVRDALSLGITDFFLGAKLAYDSLVTFGVRKVPKLLDEDQPGFVSTFTFADFVKLTDNLRARKLTGNAARDAISSAADKCNSYEWNGFYRRVLLKDFKAGLTDGTINRVLEKSGPSGKPYIIEVFTCQLAKDGKNFPKKLVGEKFLDCKLDGVRVLTVLNKENNTVVQYTRNGLINDNFTDITDKLTGLLPVITQSMVLDGEMVSASFQELMTQVNRRSDVNTTDAKLALFDIIPLKDFIAGECKITQTDRHVLLLGLETAIKTVAGDSVYVIPKLSVNLSTPEGYKTMYEFNKTAIDAGYEGIMVKNPLASYKTTRSDAWLKIKPKITVDLEVVGFEIGTPGTKNETSLGGMICKGVDNGRQISVTVGGGYSDELRADIWANQDKVLGRIAEIEADCLTLSKNNDEVWSLRFPQFLRFRGFVPGEKI